MKKVFTILTIFFLFFFCFSFVKATNPEDIVINEIAWMGRTTSSTDEWIELKNNTNENISIEGWTLRAADGSPEISLTGSISANSFYLLERTDDNTVPNITADLIYKGALGNNGEDLWLYDTNNNLIDEVNCTEEWLGGNNITKQTLEKNGGAWQTSENPGGTPKAQNSTGIVEKNIIIETPKTYEKGVYFNEILPSPKGADEENEWIEIYNSNDFEVDLSDWKIKDKNGTITTYSFEKDAKISALGYLVLKRPDTKIILNNTADGLFLLWPNGETANSLVYEKAVINQSYNKVGNIWQWSTSLTPANKNIITQTNTKTDTKTLPKVKISGNSNEVDKGLASVSQAMNQEKTKITNPWFLFLTAILITIFSSLIVLFIKYKL